MSIRWRELAGLGFSVFPVPLREKRPAMPWKAYQQRRPTEDELSRWERQESNAAIATGAISGIVVLDTDSEAGEAEVGRRGVPPTPTVRTAKGRHYYFQHPGYSVHNFARKLDGCDLRGDGYVIGPGSLHPSGAVYVWESSPSERPFAEAPGWLLALVAKEQAAAAPSPSPRSDATAYAEKARRRAGGVAPRRRRHPQRHAQSGGLQPRPAGRRRCPQRGACQASPALDRPRHRSEGTGDAGDGQERSR
jgi:hypothetical protein